MRSGWLRPGSVARSPSGCRLPAQVRVPAAETKSAAPMRFRGPTRAEFSRVWKGPLIRCPNHSIALVPTPTALRASGSIRFPAHHCPEADIDYRFMPAASPLDLVQIDQTQMDIVVVDEGIRQSVVRPRLADRLRELSGPASTRTPKPSTSRIEGQGREKSTYCAPLIAACSPESPRMSDAPAHAGTPGRVSHRLMRTIRPDAARRSPDRSSPSSRRSAATLSPILSDRHGDAAARPMRRRTPGRTGSARSLSGDIMAQIEQLRACRSDVLENRNSVDVGRRCQHKRLAGSEAHAKIFRFCGRRQPDRVFHARVGRLRQRDER